MAAAVGLGRIEEENASKVVAGRQKSKAKV